MLQTDGPDLAWVPRALPELHRREFTLFRGQGHGPSVLLAATLHQSWDMTSRGFPHDLPSLAKQNQTMKIEKKKKKMFHRSISDYSSTLQTIVSGQVLISLKFLLEMRLFQVVQPSR